MMQPTFSGTQENPRLFGLHRLSKALSQPQALPSESTLVRFRSSTLLHSFSPQRVMHPETESQLMQAVQAATAQGISIRAIGSLHSYAPIFSTRGICLVLDRYNQPVKVEGNQVTVQAGMKISELNDFLARHHLALPILGAIDQQTVSGAISTGTHGGSLHHPSLSGCVQKLRLIRADGSALEVDSSQDIFQALGLSMGLLGIISTVTFQCVPAFNLQAQSTSMSMDELLEQFDDIHQRNQYVDIKYVPITDNVQVLTINPSALRQAFTTSSLIQRSPLERKLKTAILKIMLSLFQYPQFNPLQYLLVKHHESNIFPAYQVNRSDRVLTNLQQTYYDPFPFHNMELALSYEQAPAALQVLRNYFHKTRRYPSIFIRIRCSNAEDFWLSPAYGRQTCWIDFCEYPYTGHLFKQVVELLKPFDIRSHWGKEIQTDLSYLRQRYEQWDRFLHLRQAWDPQRIFANEYLDLFLGESTVLEGVSS